MGTCCSLFGGAPSGATDDAAPYPHKFSRPGWWDAEPPRHTAVRREIRSMALADQERFAAAMMKMRENRDGPGSSPYFKLAVVHGGMPPLDSARSVASRCSESPHTTSGALASTTATAPTPGPAFDCS